MIELIALDHPQFDSLAGDILAKGNSLRFKALGRSMMPFIHDGDILTVHPVTPSCLRVGHVVLHRRTPAGVAAHRVTRVRREGTSMIFETRGDSSCSRPETVPEDRVLGRVTRRERCRRAVETDASLFLLGGRLWARLQSLRGAVRRLLPSGRTRIPETWREPAARA